jgi:hypothetical protein
MRTLSVHHPLLVLQLAYRSLLLLLRPEQIAGVSVVRSIALGEAVLVFAADVTKMTFATAGVTGVTGGRMPVEVWISTLILDR